MYNSAQNTASISALFNLILQASGAKWYKADWLREALVVRRSANGRFATAETGRKVGEEHDLAEYGREDFSKGIDEFEGAVLQAVDGEEWPEAEKEKIRQGVKAGTDLLRKVAEENTEKPNTAKYYEKASRLIKKHGEGLDNSAVMYAEITLRQNTRGVKEIDAQKFIERSEQQLLKQAEKAGKTPEQSGGFADALEKAKDWFSAKAEAIQAEIEIKTKEMGLDNEVEATKTYVANHKHLFVLAAQLTLAAMGFAMAGNALMLAYFAMPVTSNKPEATPKTPTVKSTNT